MKIKIKKFKALPFEEGKIYETKMATKEKVLITNIPLHKLSPSLFGVIYQSSSPELGVCGFYPDRLIPEYIEDGEIEVCSKCNEPIN